MDQFLGYKVIREMDYSRPFSESDHNNRSDRQTVHIDSKTCLDLFLPNSRHGGNNPLPCSENFREKSNTLLNSGDESDELTSTEMPGSDTTLSEDSSSPDGRTESSGGKFEATNPMMPTLRRRCDQDGSVLSVSVESNKDNSTSTRSHSDGNICEGKEEAFDKHSRGAARPLVVFAYGGGWRRGDKQTWRHYISRWDINLVLLANVGRLRFYDNVGESFASRGIPCAVLSYPLVPTPFPINLFEILTSFLMTIALTILSSILTYVPIEVLHFAIFSQLLSYKLWIVVRNYSQFPALTMVAGILIIAQLLTLITILLRERHLERHSVPTQPFRNNASKLSISIAAIAIIISIFTFTPSSEYFLAGEVNIVFLISGIMVLYVQYLVYHFQQLTTFSNSRHNKSTMMATPEGQAKCVAQALKWLTDYGRCTGHFDPNSIILFGHSAGGHLVSILTLDHHYLTDVGICPKVIKGVIAMSAVFDLRSLSKGALYHVYLKPAFGTDPAHWTRMSPIKYVKKTAFDGSQPPFATSSSSSSSSYLSSTSSLTSTQPQSPPPPSSQSSSTTTTTSHSSSASSSHPSPQSPLVSSRLRPYFLIISAEKDFPFMIQDSMRMYDTLHEHGYVAEWKFVDRCNHFTMIQKFGCPWYRYWTGRRKGWKPSDAEKMCWDFVDTACQQT